MLNIVLHDVNILSHSIGFRCERCGRNRSPSWYNATPSMFRTGLAFRFGAPLQRACHIILGIADTKQTG